jgi:hypothetical protein
LILILADLMLLSNCFSRHENFLNLMARRTSGLFKFTGPQWFLQAPIKYTIKSLIKTKSQSDFLIFNFHWPDLKFTGLGLWTTVFSWRLLLNEIFRKTTKFVTDFNYFFPHWFQLCLWLFTIDYKSERLHGVDKSSSS